MSTKKLQIKQLNAKMQSFRPALDPLLEGKWIHVTRKTLGISLQQLGNKLKKTRQGMLYMESSELEGSISVKGLKEVAEAMDMTLVYGFVPKDESLDALVERKAREIATTIVHRTSGTMKLEDQENSSERIREAIIERTKELVDKMPKALWD
jgi:predicted DNA-binding mobile mystery protein A